MCGIFGIITPADVQVGQREFDALGKANKDRGARGVGILAWSLKETTLYRGQTDFRADMINVEHSRLSVGHNLAPTGGVCHPHPFECEDLYLAHNGILTNWEAYKPMRPASLAIEVDSTVLLGSIWFYRRMGMGLTDAIARTAGMIEGQQACWLFDRSKEVLYLWRVMSSLWIGDLGGVTYFSSTRTEWTWEMMPEGRIFRVDMSSPRPSMEPAGEFEYKSIYKIGRHNDS